MVDDEGWTIPGAVSSREEWHSSTPIVVTTAMRNTSAAIAWLRDHGNYQNLTVARTEQVIEEWQDWQGRDLDLPVEFRFREDERELATLFKLTWGGSC